jgi:hypothetical protein
VVLSPPTAPSSETACYSGSRLLDGSGGAGGAGAAFGGTAFVTGGFAARGLDAGRFAAAAAGFGAVPPPVLFSLRTPGRERGRLPRMPSGFSFTDTS